MASKKRSARDINRAIQEFGAEKTRRLMFRIYQAVTSATPVDTGFARAGWRMSSGAPRYGDSDRPRDRAAAEAIAGANRDRNDREAQSLLQTYRIGDGRLYVSTAVSYMVHLNRGSSAQAGPAFIERSIQTAIAATRSAA